MNKTQRRQNFWIAWERQRRSTVLSEEANAKLHQLDCGGNRILRYLVCSVKTLVLLSKECPRILFVQNPSLVLAFLAALYRRLDRCRVVVDFHTPTIVLWGLKAVIFEFLIRFINRNVDLVIVTNESMKSKIEFHRGKGFVLPDKIPTFKTFQRRKLKGEYNVLFISSFAEDEPFQEVVEAARKLENINIHITGSLKRAPRRLLTDVPSSVSFTGYLPEEEYIELLNSVDVVMDLTDREGCLVCGAYEAVAAGRPLITSNSKTLMSYFDRGSVYADNTTEGIAQAITSAIKNITVLEREIEHLKHVRSAEWRRQFDDLMNLIRNS
jgi:glycosyltransferase involved in cell wall biosynthesis